MALVIYETRTGLMRRAIFDEVQTDDQLEVNHKLFDDESLLRVEAKFSRSQVLLQSLQRQINNVTGLDPTGINDD